MVWEVARLRPLLVASAALCGSAAAAFAFGSTAQLIPPAGAQPTIVELFQSQGCSSCPPANANVMALSARPDLLTLSFGVTYWDQLGWKDTFASPHYTDRQWDYARAFHRTEVFTPEVVVNGRADVAGIDRPELETLIRREARTENAADIAIGSNAATISSPRGPGHGGEVWLVRYDPNIVQVAIQRGENGGRTLPHKNVVTELVDLGAWSGRTQSYTLPTASRTGLREAILVQAGAGGDILAAAHN
jgi:hypothetical protein